jgi:lipopolysaccharide export system protein LptA
LVLIALFSSLSVKAEQTTIIADAEEMIRDRKSQTLELKGNVNVIFQQQHLLCDEAIVYEETSTIVAKGHVVLQNARTTLRGERIEFNYDTNKGKIFGGVVTSGQVLIEADIIEKVGEESVRGRRCLLHRLHDLPAFLGLHLFQCGSRDGWLCQLIRDPGCIFFKSLFYPSPIWWFRSTQKGKPVFLSPPLSPTTKGFCHRAAFFLGHRSIS